MLEKSAGAVVYRIVNGEPIFLTLHYPGGHWDYPKGKVEKGEKEVDTVIREVKEETGITDMEFVEDFRNVIKYYFKRNRKLITKFVVFLLAKTEQEKVTISFEHQAYEWLPYSEAMQKLTFANARNVLEKANSHLKTNPALSKFTGE